MAYPSNVETLSTTHSNGQVIDPAFDNDQARIINAVQAQLVSGGTHDVPGHEAAANPHPGYLTEAEADALYEPLGGGGGGASDLDDLTDVSGTQAAGTVMRRGATDYMHVGRVFSASAYGVEGSNSNSDAGDNQTAIDACIAAAKSAGVGSTVLLDWIGTAYFNGNIEIATGLVYHSVSRDTISKLANSRPAETHVWRSTNFDTLRGTTTASSGVPYGFSLTGTWCIDGNKANNATGGCGLGIYAYDFHIADRVITQNCKSSGIWLEYGSLTEPINGGYGNQHGRSATIHKIESWNSDCLALDGVGGASIVLKGPVDSEIDSIEAVRNDDPAGTGVLFASGSTACVVGHLTVWQNHDIGVNITAGDVRIKEIHAEGANTNVRIATNECKISGGEIFFPQSGGTNLHFVSGNFHKVTVNMPSCNSGGTFINFAGGNIDSEISITASEGAAVNTTLTAGTLPNARLLSITANNYGSGTMTGGGLIPEISTGFFKLLRTNGGIQVQNAARIYSGSGAPSSGLGSDGDFYFRTGTPSVANQRLYVKSAGAWTGII